MAKAMPSQCIVHLVTGTHIDSNWRSQPVSLFLDLARICRDNLRLASIFLQVSRNADPLAHVFGFGRAEFRAVITPNENGENLIRVGLIQIQERGLPATPLRKSGARDCSANGSTFAYVLLRFRRRQLLLRVAERGQKAD